MTSLYYALEKHVSFSVDYTIAVIYRCLELSEEVDGNLIWTITRNLKKVAYDGDYDPYQDEGVWAIKQKLDKPS